MSMYDAYIAGRVENLKRVYSALGNAGKLLRETAPNARDYPDGAAFEAARAVYKQRAETIARLQTEITEEAKQLQRGQA